MRKRMQHLPGKCARLLIAGLFIPIFAVAGYAGDSRPELVGEWVLDSDGSITITISGGGEVWNHPRFGRGIIRLPNDDSDLKVFYDEQGAICSYKLRRQSGANVMWLSAAHPSQSPEHCPVGKWTRLDAARPQAADETAKLREKVKQLERALAEQQSKSDEDVALKERLARVEADLHKSRQPPMMPQAIESNQAHAVREFYLALGAVDGLKASSLVVPEKREKGPFSAGEIVTFYSSLLEPLRLLSVNSIGNNMFRVTYTFRTSRMRCDGSSIVTVVERGGDPLIEKIKALNGC